MTEILPLWDAAKWYKGNGISIIPIRAKDDETGLAKSPIGGSWIKYQKVHIADDLLYSILSEANNPGVAFVCGAVSKNLLVVDVDSKYNSEITPILIRDLSFLYPDLYAKLRIHQTPSGGIHLLMFCRDAVHRNMKLANRNATAEELAVNPKQKTLCFIETRGEGGYAVAPPTMGYKVIQNNPVPVLTEDEVQQLLQLCKSYNTVFKVEEISSTTSKKNDGIYDTNPFIDFDNRCDPEQLMLELGWDKFRASGKFIWFTRPGKSKGVSLSWNHEKRFFYCFTSSTELEEKGYRPSNILSVLKFNNDKKALYQHLVSSGYGVLKPKVEMDIVRRAATSNSTKKTLPANISNDALSVHQQMLDENAEKYPFGVFWVEDLDKGILIDREILYRVSNGLGFGLFNEIDLVRTDGTYISNCNEREYYDTIRDYVKEEDADLYKDILNAWEIFVERHGKFTITRLQIIKKDAVLSDTKDHCYKFYSNGVLHITANEIQLTPYSEIKQLIWKKAIRNRFYKHQNGGLWPEFIKLATKGNKDIQKTYGYLAHEFKDETTGYIVVCAEMCEDPKDGGGSGKNVFCKMLEHVTSYCGRPGDQVKYDEKFLNGWNGERIFCLSDIPKHFNISFLKELSTGTGVMKKLFQNEYSVPVEDMCKFILQTNYGIDIKDGGIRRRAVMIEFTDFFTRAGGLDTHFGAHFPKQWEPEDWWGFDTWVAEGIQLWMKAGCKLTHNYNDLSDGLWNKQWAQEYGHVATQFIIENIEAWLRMKFVTNEEFKQHSDAFYIEKNTPKYMQPSSDKISKAIKAYCDKKGYQFQNQIVYRDGYSTKKKKWFGLPRDVPF